MSLHMVMALCLSSGVGCACLQVTKALYQWGTAHERIKTSRRKSVSHYRWCGGHRTATAQKFVTGGATVVMCDVDEVEGHEVCNTTFFAVNVADRQAVQVWVDTMADQFGRIDVLVDNRGITRDAQLIRIRDRKLVDMMSEETSDQVIDANLRPSSVAPRW
jgi:hypothetical protein